MHDRDSRSDMSDWFALMRSGHFEQAWALSDRDLPARRFVDRRTVPRHLQNVWDGSPIENRRVLVRCYHGLGDTVQFARYLPRLREAAREVIVWTPPALIPLFERSIAGVRFIPLHDGAPDVRCDVDVEIMELAHVFRTTMDTIPADVPYLHATPTSSTDERLRVGLVWRAGGWDVTRSIAFDLVEPFLRRHPQITFVPLQASLTAEERRAFSACVAVPTVERLAEEIAACDLIISVDTLAAHLAGALAAPTWTLLKSCADWRWMTGRGDSPWYPSMRLFRQPRAGAWSDVLAEVGSNLQPGVRLLRSPLEQ